MDIPRHLIGRAAKEAGVSTDTARKYEAEGLIRPVRDSSGRRLYTDADIKKIREIRTANSHRWPHLVKFR